LGRDLPLVIVYVFAILVLPWHQNGAPSGVKRGQRRPYPSMGDHHVAIAHVCAQVDGRNHVVRRKRQISSVGRTHLPDDLNVGGKDRPDAVDGAAKPKPHSPQGNDHAPQGSRLA
jgi:hypothetical protein